MPDSVSVAVMTRNEAPKLDRCLKSIIGHVDEIVVLDTGSTDDTIEVAHSHGAQVDSIEWPDSFGKGLNALIDRVRTDWTLRMDSDEWFDPDQARRVRQLAQADDISAYRLVIRDLHANGSFAELILMRMWRNAPLVRYVGAIHETIPDAAVNEAFPGKRIFNTDLFFWHDGHIDMSVKIVRNARLLEKQLEEFPDDLKSEAMLVISLRSMKDPLAQERMEQFVDRLLNSPIEERPPPSVAMMFCMYFETLSKEAVAGRRVGAVVERVLAWFPKTPSILYFAARALVGRNELEPALKTLLKLEALAMANSYDRSIPTPREFLGPALWNMLGFVASRLGHDEIARRCQMRLSGARS